MERDEAVPEQDEDPRACNEVTLDESHLYLDLQDSDEIRLLCLAPKSSGDRINCTLKHVKASDRPVYEALSYVWGARNNSQSIVVNGNDVIVRENLWSALQHLRLESDSRLLWVDAICINQQNIYERNHQVAQMGMIYKQANRVVVWLGLSDPASVLGFQLLNSPSEWTELTGSPKDLVTIMEGNEKLGAVCSLFKREYWNRLWIIQECLLAREFILQCGNRQCNGFRICWFIQLLGSVTEVPGEYDVSDWIERISVRNAIRSSKAARLMGQREPLNLKLQPQRNSARGPLLRIFALNKDAECEKWLDKVFGLASLAIACCREAVTVDYSSTWSDILGKVILHHLCAHDKNQDDDFHNLSQSLWPAPAGGDYVTKNYRHLYQEMKEASQYFKDPRLDLSGTLSNFREGFLNLPYERILVAGYLRGRITYLSPRLSTDFDTLSHSLPECTDMIINQLQYIGSLFDDSKMLQPHVPTISKILGFDQEVSGARTFSLSPIPNAQDAYPDLSQYKGGSYWDSDTWKGFHRKYDAARVFYQVLCSAKAACHRDLQSSFRLAFEENGLILFVSEKTQVGHFVCQFPRSSVIAILDGTEDFYVQQAFSFLRSPSDQAVDICGKALSFEEAEPFALAFTINPRALKNLIA